MLSEIVLLVCGVLRKKIEKGELEKETNDFVYISEKEMKSIIKECRESYSINWTKEYREIGNEKLFTNIIEYMEEWMFLKKEQEKIIIYPGIGKIIGIYKNTNKLTGGEDE